MKIGTWMVAVSVLWSMSACGDRETSSTQAASVAKPVAPPPVAAQPTPPPVTAVPLAANPSLNAWPTIAESRAELDALEARVAACTADATRADFEVRACITALYGDWDAALNREYRALMRTLDEAGRETLRLEERAWLRARDQAFEKLEAEHGNAGNAGLMTIARGRNEVVRLRVMQLHGRRLEPKPQLAK